MTLAAPARAVIKPWILPTGNAFINDPARRFVRPSGNLGGDVAYVRGDFDDCSWQRVSLPHDWAIAGPFITTGNVGGMGRLPSPGVGWYRKKLNVPASDAGKSIFLDIDGAMSYATVWLNGRIVGGWPFGYASWRVDALRRLERRESVGDPPGQSPRLVPRVSGRRSLSQRLADEDPRYLFTDGRSDLTRVM